MQVVIKHHFKQLQAVLSVIKRRTWLLAFSVYFGLSFNSAYADDYGCRVLLCLSDPRGPMTEKECRPDIKRLWRDLSKGKSFPRCVFAKNLDNKVYAKHGYSYFDACSPGTVALKSGEYGIKKGSTKLYVGIGEETSISRIGYPPSKICVANPVGKSWYRNEYGFVPYTVYDTLIEQKPAASPRYIDIFFNGQLSHRVRW